MKKIFLLLALTLCISTCQASELSRDCFGIVGKEVKQELPNHLIKDVLKSIEEIKQERAEWARMRSDRPTVPQVTPPVAPSRVTPKYLNYEQGWAEARKTGRNLTIVRRLTQAEVEHYAQEARANGAIFAVAGEDDERTPIGIADHVFLQPGQSPPAFPATQENILSTPKPHGMNYRICPKCVNCPDCKNCKDRP